MWLTLVWGLRCLRVCLWVWVILFAFIGCLLFELLILCLCVAMLLFVYFAYTLVDVVWLLNTTCWNRFDIIVVCWCCFNLGCYWCLTVNCDVIDSFVCGLIGWVLVFITFD